MVVFDAKATAYYLHTKLHLDQFIVSSKRQKTQSLPHFQIQHPVVAPLSRLQQKLNEGAQ